MIFLEMRVSICTPWQTFSDIVHLFVNMLSKELKCLKSIFFKSNMIVSLWYFFYSFPMLFRKSDSVGVVVIDDCYSISLLSIENTLLVISKKKLNQRKRERWRQSIGSKKKSGPTMYVCATHRRIVTKWKQRWWRGLFSYEDVDAMAQFN